MSCPIRRRLPPNYAPLRDVRSRIARVFAEGGWKQAPSGSQAEIHELWKTSPGGRPLGLLFSVQERGRSSRSISGTIQLVSERRSLTLSILAERSKRREYEVPNSQVLSQILDDMRVVVKYLENTWVKELEEALGSGPLASKLG